MYQFALQRENITIIIITVLVKRTYYVKIYFAKVLDKL